MTLGIVQRLVLAALVVPATQQPGRVDVVKPEHQARASAEPCAMSAPARVKAPYTSASPQGTWSAHVLETDVLVVPYDQAHACIRLQRRGGAVRYVALRDFRTLRLEWLDERQLRLLTDVGHAATVTQVLDVDALTWIYARTEYYWDSRPPSVEAVLRVAPSRVPELAYVGEIRSWAGSVNASYQSLRVTVESYDSVEAAEEGWRRSGMRPAMPTRRETIDGRLLTWWSDNILLARAGRHVVNIVASESDAMPLVTKTFQYLAPQLEALAPQARPPTSDEFPVVTGDGYAGAIVPASSPWHQFFKNGLQHLITGRPVQSGSGFAPWTPSAEDIVLIERDLAEFVRTAADDPARVRAMVPDDARVATTSQLPWLRSNLRALTRQYFGAMVGTSRIVLVHGFQGQPISRWRTEVIIIMDGGCGNVWFEVNLTERRVMRIACGGMATPAPLTREE